MTRTANIDKDKALAVCAKGLELMLVLDDGYARLSSRQTPMSARDELVRKFAKATRALELVTFQLLQLDEKTLKPKKGISKHNLDIELALIQGELIASLELLLTKAQVREYLLSYYLSTRVFSTALNHKSKPGLKARWKVYRAVGFILDEWVNIGLPTPSASKTGVAVRTLTEFLAAQKNMLLGKQGEGLVSEAVKHWRDMRKARSRN